MNITQPTNNAKMNIGVCNFTAKGSAEKAQEIFVEWESSENVNYFSNPEYPEFLQNFSGGLEYLLVRINDKNTKLWEQKEYMSVLLAKLRKLDEVSMWWSVMNFKGLA